MTVNKVPLCPDKIRRVPEQFSWVDHRLVRERYIDSLSTEAAALYLFLVTVSDTRGLSYYGDATLQKRLGLDAHRLVAARGALAQQGLIAFSKPLYQVLALDHRREMAATTGEPCSIGQILRQVMGGGA
ncbi:MAG: hypothetical protein JZU65_12685 [Chlorobium sp.]|nr:hypothetical protein [Chlorobium sp.]